MVTIEIPEEHAAAPASLTGGVPQLRELLRQELECFASTVLPQAVEEAMVRALAQHGAAVLIPGGSGVRPPTSPLPVTPVRPFESEASGGTPHKNPSRSKAFAWGRRVLPFRSERSPQRPGAHVQPGIAPEPRRSIEEPLEEPPAATAIPTGPPESWPTSGRLLHSETSEELQSLVRPHDRAAARHTVLARGRSYVSLTPPGFEACLTNVHCEYIVTALILVNAVMIGVETDYEAATGRVPLPLAACDVAFCVVFALELLLRICIQRARFFTEDLGWNLVDVLVVISQLGEQVLKLAVLLHIPINARLLHILRTLRPIRIARIVRVMWSFQALRAIAASIASSMKSLGWTLLLLSIVIYICSIFFTVLAMDAVKKNSNANTERLGLWFGGVWRTALTLFESIVGGVSWDEVVRPLFVEVSAIAGLLYCGFISFCAFALMNTLTGVIVDSTVHTAKEHKARHLANHVSNLFKNDAEAHYGISWPSFKSKMNDEDMRIYFHEINVDPSEAKTLFELLDQDGSGSVDAGELVDGLMRLRGNATALDLASYANESRFQFVEVGKRQKQLQRQMQHLGQALEHKVREMTAEILSSGSQEFTPTVTGQPSATLGPAPVPEEPLSPMSSKGTDLLAPRPSPPRPATRPIRGASLKWGSSDL